MRPLYENDTIIAASTPPFPSGVAVIRISGADALRLFEYLFKPRGKKKSSEIPPRYIVAGNVIEPISGKIIDEALGVRFAAPSSYTGEDMAEIHCHGNPYITKLIIETAISLQGKQGLGAVRPAGRGEFTYRAFLNGKIDLIQAEAVLTVIESRSADVLAGGLARLKGRLSEISNRWKKELTEIMALVDFSIDMPDESEEEQKNGAEILSRIISLKESIDKILSNSSRHILEGEIPVALVGKPNTGKSSLFNALAREDLAIVTPVAGTTRDVISETLHWDGITWRISDTAGISSTSPTDIVEKIGREKALKTAQKTFIAILVLDRSKTLDSDDIRISRELKDLIREKRVVAALNKSDLTASITEDDVKKTLGLSDRDTPVVNISAARDEGIDELKSALSKIVAELTSSGKTEEGDEIFAGNIRQKTSLESCSSNLGMAINDFSSDKGAEIVAHHLKSAADDLRELTGEITGEDILGEIFSKFCVGK